MAEPPRTFSARAQPLIEEAAVRSRLSARTRAERLRDAARPILQATLAATIQIDIAVRNVQVLARGARRAIDLDENVPPEAASAVRELAHAVQALGEALDDPDRGGAVREPALRAAGQATLVLERTGNMSVTVIVGQVRSTAVDLLRGSGMTYDEAADAVRAAVRDAESLGQA